MRNAIKCLQHLTQESNIETPDENIIVFGADYSFKNLDRFQDKKQTIFIQPDKGIYLDLIENGSKVIPSLHDACAAELEGLQYECAIVIATKQKLETLAIIAQAAIRCKNGTHIWIAGEKNIGIASIATSLEKYGTISHKTSKSHALAFIFTAFENSCCALKKIINQANSCEFTDNSSLVKRKWYTHASIFSHSKIDQGSQLLRDNINQKLEGNVADLGAGWGYLSRSLFDLANIDQLDLYEVNFHAVNAARQNLSDIDAEKTNFFWHDIIKEKITRRYDHVIMNPPFHKGKNTQASLGLSFIKTAHAILRDKGTMTMVANRHLPYEETLNAIFKRVKNIDERDGFKVLHATR